ncbi:uncharacterized protein LOC104891375 [Beta vulgaris subsp. vulgaris]|uniref:uncharacterized protein LOC104891375 n=1 Tax=Beta vulgaris subsp. vulgaris TaxID=3555 RepID=UPI002036B49B|nr:uncharacterized protein LOC104891375 [Beta vulgaris subsp. vulgaris]
MFHCSIVYASNDAKEREVVWEELENIASGSKLPWMVVGDYSCALNPYERVGCIVRQQETMSLQRCVQRCGLQDMASTGNKYTWNNKQFGESRVFCKLDRAMINQEWLNCFPTAMTDFLPEGKFDHSPIVIMVYPSLVIRNHPFKYFKMWSTTPNFIELLRDDWGITVQGTFLFKVVQKLKNTKKALKKKLNAEGYLEIQSKDIQAYHKMITYQE